MRSATAESKATRVGIFDTVVDADRAVRNLLAAGFSKKELGVLCSMQSLKSFFPDLAEPHLAKAHSTQTIPAGGAVGASIGGLALAVLAATTTGGLGILAAGAILVGGGALAGLFAGAIYGIEKAKGEYYDQALQQGKILVAVDLEGEQPTRLAEADQILAEAGAAEVHAIGGYP